MEFFPTQMSLISLFALPSGLEITAYSRQEGVLCVSLLATQPSSHCPLCGSAATRIHSRYQRRLADLPSTGQPVRFLLTVRKIFTERLVPFVARFSHV
jgi:transposase